jgi:adenylyltransferase/sulfurtransferase
VLPGLIGLIQATEVLKLAAGVGKSLLNRLLLYDALEMRFRELKLRRDPQCALCGERPSITRLIDYEGFCGITPPAEAESIHPDEVTVQELKKALDNPDLGICAIDVREPYEHRVAHIQGVPLMPLSQLAQRFTELNPDQTYYLYCKMGVRSLTAVEFLRQHGFKSLKSVRGGINAWSEEIDPSVPNY